MATKYRAVCLQCYTCHLTPPVSKRDAERAATSHMTTYQHPVTLQRVTAPTRPVKGAS